MFNYDNPPREDPDTTVALREQLKLAQHETRQMSEYSLQLERQIKLRDAEMEELREGSRLALEHKEREISSLAHENRSLQERARNLELVLSEARRAAPQAAQRSEERPFSDRAGLDLLIQNISAENVVLRKLVAHKECVISYLMNLPPGTKIDGIADLLSVTEPSAIQQRNVEALLKQQLRKTLGSERRSPTQRKAGSAVNSRSSSAHQTIQPHDAQHVGGHEKGTKVLKKQLDFLKKTTADLYKSLFHLQHQLTKKLPPLDLSLSSSTTAVCDLWHALDTALQTSGNSMNRAMITPAQFLQRQHEKLDAIERHIVQPSPRTNVKERVKSSGYGAVRSARVSQSKSVVCTTAPVAAHQEAMVMRPLPVSARGPEQPQHATGNDPRRSPPAGIPKSPQQPGLMAGSTPPNSSRRSTSPAPREREAKSFPPPESSGEADIRGELLRLREERKMLEHDNALRRLQLLYPGGPCRPLSSTANNASRSQSADPPGGLVTREEQ